MVTSLVAAWATGAANLTGLNDDADYTLAYASGSISLSGILLCGLIISGLGVLNDVTITQSSAVWEMHELAPESSARRLFAGAMRVGRDHIASTVYTIVFAYAGAALPLLILLSLQDRPFLETISSGELAEEIVRTLVGSIGLVLAIPVTTAIAVLVVKAVGSKPSILSGSEAPASVPDSSQATDAVSAANQPPRVSWAAGLNHSATPRRTTATAAEAVPAALPASNQAHGKTEAMTRRARRQRDTGADLES